MSDLNDAIAREIQSLSPSARIELFVVDLSLLGDTVYRFHAGTNGLLQPIVWQGATYTPWPCEATGFELTTNGQLPRPKLTLANVTGALSALALAFDDCVGAKVTRKVTLQKFLDAVNFPDGNPNADPNAYFPDDVYFIDRKSLEDKDVIEFELAAAFDVTGVKLPRRQIIQNLCSWKYRGAECGYTGAPVADHTDKYLTSNDTVTEAEQTVINLAQDMRDAKTTLELKRSAMNRAYNTMLSKEGKVKVEEKFKHERPMPFGYSQPDISFVATDPGGKIVRFAFWMSGAVDIGDVYRLGDNYIEPHHTDYWAYPIERWAHSESAYEDAEDAYNLAVSEFNTAETVYNGLRTSYNSAVGSLSTNSALYKQDVCGKRLTSCKLRFGGKADLPFGGFPGAGLTA